MLMRLKSIIGSLGSSIFYDIMCVSFRGAKLLFISEGYHSVLSVLLCFYDILAYANCNAIIFEVLGCLKNRIFVK